MALPLPPSLPSSATRSAMSAPWATPPRAPRALPLSPDRIAISGASLERTPLSSISTRPSAPGAALPGEYILTRQAALAAPSPARVSVAGSDKSSAARFFESQERAVALRAARRALRSFEVLTSDSLLRPAYMVWHMQVLVSRTERRAIKLQDLARRRSTHASDVLLALLEAREESHMRAALAVWRQLAAAQIVAAEKLQAVVATQRRARCHVSLAMERWMCTHEAEVIRILLVAWRASVVDAKRTAKHLMRWIKSKDNASASESRELLRASIRAWLLHIVSDRCHREIDALKSQVDDVKHSRVCASRMLTGLVTNDVLMFIKVALLLWRACVIRLQRVRSQAVRSADRDATATSRTCMGMCLHSWHEVAITSKARGCLLDRVVAFAIHTSKCSKNSAFVVAVLSHWRAAVGNARMLTGLRHKLLNSIMLAWGGLVPVLRQLREVRFLKRAMQRFTDVVAINEDVRIISLCFVTWCHASLLTCLDRCQSQISSLTTRAEFSFEKERRGAKAAVVSLIAADARSVALHILLWWHTFANQRKCSVVGRSCRTRIAQHLGDLFMRSMLSSLLGAWCRAVVGMHRVLDASRRQAEVGITGSVVLLVFHFFASWRFVAFAMKHLKDLEKSRNRWLLVMEGALKILIPKHVHLELRNALAAWWSTVKARRLAEATEQLCMHQRGVELAMVVIQHWWHVVKTIRRSRTAQCNASNTHARLAQCMDAELAKKNTLNVLELMFGSWRGEVVIEKRRKLSEHVRGRFLLRMSTDLNKRHAGIVIVIVLASWWRWLLESRCAKHIADTEAQAQKQLAEMRQRLMLRIFHNFSNRHIVMVFDNIISFWRNVVLEARLAKVGDDASFQSETHSVHRERLELKVGSEFKRGHDRSIMTLCFGLWWRLVLDMRAHQAAHIVQCSAKLHMFKAISAFCYRQERDHVGLCISRWRAVARASQHDLMRMLGAVKLLFSGQPSSLLRFSLREWRQAVYATKATFAQNQYTDMRARLVMQFGDRQLGGNADALRTVILAAWRKHVVAAHIEEFRDQTRARICLLFCAQMTSKNATVMLGIVYGAWRRGTFETYLKRGAEVVRADTVKMIAITNWLLAFESVTMIRVFLYWQRGAAQNGAHRLTVTSCLNAAAFRIWSDTALLPLVFAPWKRFAGEMATIRRHQISKSKLHDFIGTSCGNSKVANIYVYFLHWRMDTREEQHVRQHKQRLADGQEQLIARTAMCLSGHISNAVAMLIVGCWCRLALVSRRQRLFVDGRRKLVTRTAAYVWGNISNAALLLMLGYWCQFVLSMRLDRTSSRHSEIVAVLAANCRGNVHACALRRSGDNDLALTHAVMQAWRSLTTIRTFEVRAEKMDGSRNIGMQRAVKAWCSSSETLCLIVIMNEWRRANHILQNNRQEIALQHAQHKIEKNTQQTLLVLFGLQTRRLGLNVLLWWRIFCISRNFQRHLSNAGDAIATYSIVLLAASVISRWHLLAGKAHIETAARRHCERFRECILLQTSARMFAKHYDIFMFALVASWWQSTLEEKTRRGIAASTAGHRNGRTEMRTRFLFLMNTLSVSAVMGAVFTSWHKALVEDRAARIVRGVETHRRHGAAMLRAQVVSLLVARIRGGFVVMMLVEWRLLVFSSRSRIRAIDFEHMASAQRAALEYVVNAMFGGDASTCCALFFNAWRQCVYTCSVARTELALNNARSEIETRIRQAEFAFIGSNMKRLRSQVLLWWNALTTWRFRQRHVCLFLETTLCKHADAQAARMLKQLLDTWLNSAEKIASAHKTCAMYLIRSVRSLLGVALCAWSHFVSIGKQFRFERRHAAHVDILAKRLASQAHRMVADHRISLLVLHLLNWRIVATSTHCARDVSRIAIGNQQALVVTWLSSRNSFMLLRILQTWYRLRKMRESRRNAMWLYMDARSASETLSFMSFFLDVWMRAHSAKVRLLFIAWDKTFVRHNELACKATVVFQWRHQTKMSHIAKDLQTQTMNLSADFKRNNYKVAQGLRAHIFETFSLKWLDTFWLLILGGWQRTAIASRTERASLNLTDARHTFASVCRRNSFLNAHRRVIEAESIVMYAILHRWRAKLTKSAFQRERDRLIRSGEYSQSRAIAALFFSKAVRILAVVVREWRWSTNLKCFDRDAAVVHAAQYNARKTFCKAVLLHVGLRSRRFSLHILLRWHACVKQQRFRCMVIHRRAIGLETISHFCFLYWQLIVSGWRQVRLMETRWAHEKEMRLGSASVLLASRFSALLLSVALRHWLSGVEDANKLHAMRQQQSVIFKCLSSFDSVASLSVLHSWHQAVVKGQIMRKSVLLFVESHSFTSCTDSVFLLTFFSQWRRESLHSVRLRVTRSSRTKMVGVLSSLAATTESALMHCFLSLWRRSSLDSRRSRDRQALALNWRHIRVTEDTYEALLARSLSVHVFSSWRTIAVGDRLRRSVELVQARAWKLQQQRDDGAKRRVLTILFSQDNAMMQICIRAWQESRSLAHIDSLSLQATHLRECLKERGLDHALHVMAWSSTCLLGCVISEWRHITAFKLVEQCFGLSSKAEIAERERETHDLQVSLHSMWSRSVADALRLISWTRAFFMLSALIGWQRVTVVFRQHFRAVPLLARCADESLMRIVVQEWIAVQREVRSLRHHRDASRRVAFRFISGQYSCLMLNALAAWQRVVFASRQHGRVVPILARCNSSLMRVIVQEWIAAQRDVRSLRQHREASRRAAFRFISGQHSYVMSNALAAWQRVVFASRQHGRVVPVLARCNSSLMRVIVQEWIAVQREVRSLRQHREASRRVAFRFISGQHSYLMSNALAAWCRVVFASRQHCRVVPVLARSNSSLMRVVIQAWRLFQREVFALRQYRLKVAGRSVAIFFSAQHGVLSQYCFSAWREMTSADRHERLVGTLQSSFDASRRDTTRGEALRLISWHRAYFVLQTLVAWQQVAFAARHHYRAELVLTRCTCESLMRISLHGWVAVHRETNSLRHHRLEGARQTVVMLFAWQHGVLLSSLFMAWLEHTSAARSEYLVNGLQTAVDARRQYTLRIISWQRAYFALSTFVAWQRVAVETRLEAYSAARMVPMLDRSSIRQRTFLLLNALVSWQRSARTARQLYRFGPFLTRCTSESLLHIILHRWHVTQREISSLRHHRLEVAHQNAAMMFVSQNIVITFSFFNAWRELTSATRYESLASAMQTMSDASRRDASYRHVLRIFSWQRAYAVSSAFVSWQRVAVGARQLYRFSLVLLRYPTEALLRSVVQRWHAVRTEVLSLRHHRLELAHQRVALLIDVHNRVLSFSVYSFWRELTSASRYEGLAESLLSTSDASHRNASRRDAVRLISWQQAYFLVNSLISWQRVARASRQRYRAGQVLARCNSSLMRMVVQGWREMQREVPLRQQRLDAAGQSVAMLLASQQGLFLLYYFSVWRENYSADRHKRVVRTLHASSDAALRDASRRDALLHISWQRAYFLLNALAAWQHVAFSARQRYRIAWVLTRCASESLARIVMHGWHTLYSKVLLLRHHRSDVAHQRVAMLFVSQSSVLSLCCLSAWRELTSRARYESLAQALQTVSDASLRDARCRHALRMLSWQHAYVASNALTAWQRVAFAARQIYRASLMLARRTSESLMHIVVYAWHSVHRHVMSLWHHRVEFAHQQVATLYASQNVVLSQWLFSTWRELASAARDQRLATASRSMSDAGLRDSRRRFAFRLISSLIDYSLLSAFVAWKRGVLAAKQHIRIGPVLARCTNSSIIRNVVQRWCEVQRRVRSLRQHRLEVAGHSVAMCFASQQGVLSLHVFSSWQQITSTDRHERRVRMLQTSADASRRDAIHQDAIRLISWQRAYFLFSALVAWQHVAFAARQHYRFGMAWAKLICESSMRIVVHAWRASHTEVLSSRHHRLQITSQSVTMLSFSQNSVHSLYLFNAWRTCISTTRLECLAKAGASRRSTSRHHVMHSIAWQRAYFKLNYFNAWQRVVFEARKQAYAATRCAPLLIRLAVKPQAYFLLNALIPWQRAARATRQFGRVAQVLARGNSALMCIVVLGWWRAIQRQVPSLRQLRLEALGQSVAKVLASQHGVLLLYYFSSWREIALIGRYDRLVLVMQTSLAADNRDSSRQDALRLISWQRAYFLMSVLVAWQKVALPARQRSRFGPALARFARESSLRTVMHAWRALHTHLLSSRHHRLEVAHQRMTMLSMSHNSVIIVYSINAWRALITATRYEYLASAHASRRNASRNHAIHIITWQLAYFMLSMLLSWQRMTLAAQKEMRSLRQHNRIGLVLARCNHSSLMRNVVQGWRAVQKGARSLRQHRLEVASHGVTMCFASQQGMLSLYLFSSWREVTSTDRHERRVSILQTSADASRRDATRQDALHHISWQRTCFSFRALVAWQHVAFAARQHYRFGMALTRLIFESFMRIVVHSWRASHTEVLSSRHHRLQVASQSVSMLALSQNTVLTLYFINAWRALASATRYEHLANVHARRRNSSQCHALHIITWQLAYFMLNMLVSWQRMTLAAQREMRSLRQHNRIGLVLARCTHSSLMRNVVQGWRAVQRRVRSLRQHRLEVAGHSVAMCFASQQDMLSLYLFSSWRELTSTDRHERQVRIWQISADASRRDATHRDMLRLISWHRAYFLLSTLLVWQRVALPARKHYRISLVLARSTKESLMRIIMHRWRALDTKNLSLRDHQLDIAHRSIAMLSLLQNNVLAMYLVHAWRGLVSASRNETLASALQAVSDASRRGESRSYALRLISWQLAYIALNALVNWQRVALIARHHYNVSERLKAKQGSTQIIHAALLHWRMAATLLCMQAVHTVDIDECLMQVSHLREQRKNQARDNQLRLVVWSHAYFLLGQLIAWRLAVVDARRDVAASKGRRALEYMRTQAVAALVSKQGSDLLVVLMHSWHGLLAEARAQRTNEQWLKRGNELHGRGAHMAIQLMEAGRAQFMILDIWSAWRTRATDSRWARNLEQLQWQNLAVSQQMAKQKHVIMRLDQRWASQSLVPEWIFLLSSMVLWYGVCQQQRLDQERIRLQAEADKLFRENAVLRSGRESRQSHAVAIMEGSMRSAALASALQGI